MHDNLPHQLYGSPFLDDGSTQFVCIGQPYVFTGRFVVNMDSKQKKNGILRRPTLSKD